MPDSKFFGVPFGTSGDKATIPEATQPSGAISYQQGFGPDYERDPGTDPLAKRVPRDETNEIYFQVTNAIKFLQLYGLPEWYDVDDTGADVSYPITARVRHAGKAWVSIAATNTATPGTDPTKWLEDVAFNLPDLEASLAEMLAGTSGSKIATPRRVATAAQRGVWSYAVAGGTANALSAALTPVPASLASLQGATINLGITATNTGSATLNLNGLGAQPILRPDGNPLRPGDLQAGSVFAVTWSGSAFVVSSPQSINGFFQRVRVPPANYAVVPEDSGTMFYCITGGVPTTTLSLPVASSMPGAYLGFFANNGTSLPAMTVSSTAGSSRILIAGSPPISLMQLRGVYTFFFVYSDGSNWIVIASSPNLAFEVQQNLAGGYQKHPGGLITQWGEVTIAGNSSVTVSFPVAFTAGNYTVVASPSDTDPTSYRFTAAPVSLTQFVVTNTKATTVTGRYSAVGY